MPSQVRIISPRNSSRWDDLVRDVLRGGQLGQEQDYFGCVSQERADQVRRALRTASKHQGAGSKVFWYKCPDPARCHGGAGCRYHVSWTIYDLDAARAYRASQSQDPRRRR